MDLVELINLSYRYGTAMYAVDRVNGTMYGKFSVGHKSIPEKATVIPQYQHTPVEDEYRASYENTLPEITNIATLVAKSTPVTQASQIPVISNVPERDIVEPVSSERARTAYLEWQIQDMSSVWLPLNIPSMEEESRAPTDLSGRIHVFCREQKEKKWCRFLILLVESWRIVIISGTVHCFWLKTSFHPLLWTSSRKALTKCNYPKWALDKVEKRLNKSSSQVNDRGNQNAQSANQGVPSKGHIVIPYTQGLCESIKKICGRHGIQTHFKGGRTIKNLLVSPKDKDPMVNQSGAIYWYQCGDLGCDDEYIGETSRTFGERYKEHLKAPSAIHHHSSQTGHTTNHNNFQIIGREGQNLASNIKESIYIRVNNPSLSNNIGKFNLSHIWDRVLLNTNGLSLK